MLTNSIALSSASLAPTSERPSVSAPRVVSLAAVCDLDISVSHADRRFVAPVVAPGESPLLAALVAMAALGDVSLCTPARRIRSL
jgi:hypothetical protein